MKHTRLTRPFSLLLTLAFLLAFIPAPAAFAASDTFITGCQASGVPVYYAMDTTSKTYTTLDLGARVNVRDRYNNTWWRVNVENNLYSTEGTFSVGYVRADSGFLPANIPTDTFIGESTTTKACLLYSYASTSRGNLAQLSTGTKMKVVQQIGDFYLVFVSPQFYGFVSTSDCTAFSITAPTVTAAPTTTSAGNASSAAVGFDDLNVASKGKLAPMAMLYGINDMTSKPIAQTSTGGDAQVYYRVANDFYLISTGQNYAFYAYVPTQSITVYDMAAVPHLPGVVNAISSISNGQTIVSAGAASAGKTSTIANCTSWVSMRAKASSSSKRLYKLTKGKSVTVLGTEGSYTKIQYDGQTGYVLSTYVK